MKFYQRVANIIANEGFTGLSNRLINRVPKPRFINLPTTDSQASLDEYDHLVKFFQDKASSLDFPGLDRFLWYHTIDLGNDIITPGNYDYRNLLDNFLFPEDMSNMHVLDVGSATGFFSFEFEKRGATVTSVELPSIENWDMPHGEDKTATLQELMEIHKTNDIDELQYLHLDGPFLFCRKMLNSNVTRCYSSIYDVYPEKLKNQQFDLVYLGDILLHIFSPLQALASIAPLCRGKLIISQNMPELLEDQPIMLYLGGTSRRGDSRTWWYPNKTCFTQLLKRVGFRTVEFVREFEVVHRPTGGISKKTVIHASK